MTLQQAIQIEADFKPRKKILKKLAEECSELTTKILQKSNNDNKVSDDDIMEEIVDVQMLLDTAIINYGEDYFNRMREVKTKKFLDSKEFNKYLQKSINERVSN